MTITAIFTAKAGIGKTTLACNMAHALASAGRQTLVVDLDPQCGASLMMLGEAGYHKGFLAGVTTTSDLLSSVHAGEGYVRRLSTLRSESFGVSVLPASPDLSLHEDLLSGDWIAARAGTMRGVLATLAISNAVRRLAADYDEVIIDCGTSLGSLNRAALLASDRFISPVGDDVMSLAALRTAGQWIENWAHSWDFVPEMVGRTREEMALATGHELPACPVFAGYVASHASWPRSFSAQATGDLDKAARQLAAATCKDAAAPGRIGSIGWTPGPAHIARGHHLPICKLGKTEGIVGAMFSHIRQFELSLQDLIGALDAAAAPAPSLVEP